MNNKQKETEEARRIGEQMSKDAIKKCEPAWKKVQKAFAEANSHVYTQAELDKSVVDACKEVAQELMEFYARHAHSTLYTGGATREGDPISRLVPRFGGPSDKQKGFSYWITAQELAALHAKWGIG